MCGRVTLKTNIAGLMRAFAGVARDEGDGLDEIPQRWNGAPRQDYPLIIREPDRPGPVFMSARWGLIPYWIKEEDGGRQPINARCEGIASNGMFRAAYRARRALMPIDGFFEWKAILGSKVKQPYAIAMKTGEPFALAAIWEEWRDPRMGTMRRTFAVVTCEANAMMREIHERMPVILSPGDYDRWLGEEPDPRDLMVPFPSDLMTMWPISTKVGSPKNDTPDILDRIDGADA